MGTPIGDVHADKTRGRTYLYPHDCTRLVEKPGRVDLLGTILSHGIGRAHTTICIRALITAQPKVRLWNACVSNLCLPLYNPAFAS
jgi:hypothetical protein